MVRRTGGIVNHRTPNLGSDLPPVRSLSSAAIDRLDDIDGIRWLNVVVGLEITGGACQAIQVVDFAPRVALGESSTHGVNLRQRAQPAPPP
jgi:hypothetical protein